ncbi:hypothetical protein ACSAZL_12315 [Methanosarcina sp. T3]|uniref:hypothetical protein n=1 Tax=Methanosarcina sp. T3 TaxID=3439062 RepID=UPI003F834347
MKGKKVLSPSLIRELSTPRIPIPSGYDKGSYGYGLYLYEHRGVKVVGHSGGLEGFACQFLMVPEHRFVGKGGQLFLKLGGLEAPVEKVGEQRFVTYHPLTQQPVEFVLVSGEDGKPACLHIERRALKKV